MANEYFLHMSLQVFLFFESPENAQVAWGILSSRRVGQEVEG